MCDEGSSFEVYLLALKGRALRATNRRKALDEVLESFYAKAPGSRELLAVLFADADDPTPAIVQFLDVLTESQARGMLVWTDYTCASQFRLVEHRENILRGALSLFIDRFGPGVVPDDVRTSVPELVSKLVGCGRTDPKKFVARHVAQASERNVAR